VAGSPLFGAPKRVEKTLRGGSPLTPLRRGWAPTKTVRTKSISTERTISLKTTPRRAAPELAQVPRLERRHCFVVARPLGIRRKRGVVRAVELSVHGIEEN